MPTYSSLLIFFSQIGDFWSEKLARSLFRWNLFFIAVQVASILLTYSFLPPQVPLNYSLPWGDFRLVPAHYLFLVPLFSVIVILINYFLASILRTISVLLWHLLVIFSLLYSIFSSLTLVEIIIAVT